MQALQTVTLKRALSLATCLLVLKVTVGVLTNYPDYFPPNFRSDFLHGRESYFFGNYQWAFYTHLLSGPISLILGTILISERFRRAFPKWHRYLGRVQGVCVLFFVAPSGLCMAYRAASGVIAAAGFATLSIALAICMTMGWRTAIQRRFADHRRWMLRCYLMLCSAVVLRLFAGLATVTALESEWIYPLSAWASWLGPLSVNELREWRIRRKQHPKSRPILNPTF